VEEDVSDEKREEQKKRKVGRN